ncbi:MAG TPA: PilZ domain-containing protein [Limnobacter sp.]|uniref:PilZ domain-containing protein n=1 Tax=Limnobacter sp. TaxID=2003368 RepID=UPI002EDBB582
MSNPSVTTPVNKAAKESARPWMLSLNLTDKGHVAQVYMPFIKGGGVFVETDKDYNLGDPVFVLLTVGDEGRRFPINGKVVWICGPNARGDKPQGIGIQFPKDDSGESARLAIEQMVGKMMHSVKKTSTL